MEAVAAPSFFYSRSFSQFTLSPLSRSLEQATDWYSSETKSNVSLKYSVIDICTRLSRRPGVTSEYSATPQNVHPVRRDHVSSGHSPEAINSRKIQSGGGGLLRDPGGGT